MAALTIDSALTSSRDGSWTTLPLTTLNRLFGDRKKQPGKLHISSPLLRSSGSVPFFSHCLTASHYAIAIILTFYLTRLPLADMRILGSMADVPKDLLQEIKRLEDLFTVDRAKLKAITNHFVSELDKGTNFFNTVERESF